MELIRIARWISWTLRDCGTSLQSALQIAVQQDTRLFDREVNNPSAYMPSLPCAAPPSADCAVGRRRRGCAPSWGGGPKQAAAATAGAAKQAGRRRRRRCRAEQGGRRRASKQATSCRRHDKFVGRSEYPPDSRAGDCPAQLFLMRGPAAGWSFTMPCILARSDSGSEAAELTPVGAGAGADAAGVAAACCGAELGGMTAILACAAFRLRCSLRSASAKGSLMSPACAREQCRCMRSLSLAVCRTVKRPSNG